MTPSSSESSGNGKAGGGSPVGPGFVHLHNHSDYSLLDGAMKIRSMVEKAAVLGQPALALTDHGNLFGAVEFYLACRKAGVKPILGMEAYVARNHADRSTKDAQRNHHLVLLARNAQGWRNLVKLASLAYLDGFYYKPRIDKELLSAHSDGLVGLSACLAGEPNALLARGQMEAAVAAAAEYRDILGPDHYFLEIQNHGLPEEEKVRQLMPKVAREIGVSLVATNDCHFLERAHFAAHDILLAIQTGKTLSDEARWKSATPEVYFKTTDEMRQLFQDWPDALENTLRVADLVDFELETDRLLLPEFPLPDGFAGPDAYVEHLAREGLSRRYGEITGELRERLEYELGIIRQTGYAGYFLIVWDFIDAARRRKIPVGPGRGSAAGSLVCYCMGITDVDPIANRLLFERFLNPDRISMPDIDVDFCYEKRPEIIRYVENKYGRDNVSQIITFGTMAARAVIKDVARVLDVSFQDADRISKLVPEEIGITLQKALDEAPGLKELRAENPLYDRLIENALVLEGLKRNPGIHAAGVLITPTPLVNHCPLYKSTKGDVTTQFDMKMAEKLGLLKMDFLGLRTLTVIDKALKLVEETTGRVLAPPEIPLDDPATFALLQQGRTVGVFQLESGGMQELVRKMRPTSYDDITAINALYRPGPLGAGMDEVYVERKHGRQRTTYKHPDLEAILGDTYGVILYQEQVMQIASKMGGFSLGQADTLRKAMGKKKIEMMEELKVKFLEGARAGGYDERLAREIYEEMAHFAQYGFNKSHSAAYAVLSIQTAWLKAHHPAEFMAATMTTEMRKAERITQLIDECKVMGLAIRPPDIDHPRAEFGVRDGAIVFGMGAVKGVGTKAIGVIAAAREALGRDFIDLFDVCEHLDLQKVNRKVLEALIHAGAMDALPGGRRTQIVNLDRALAYGQKVARDREGGQDSLFGGNGGAAATLRPVLEESPPFDPLVRLSMEKAAVGFFLSGHPFQEYHELIEALDVGTASGAASRGDGAWVDLLGVITSHTRARDRHKRVYARCHFEDRTGMLGVTVYSRLWEQVKPLIESDSVLVVGGRVQVRSDGQRELVADRVTRIDEVLGCWTDELLVSLDLDRLGGAGLRELESLLTEFGRPTPLPPLNRIDLDPLLAGGAAGHAAGPYRTASGAPAAARRVTAAPGPGARAEEAAEGPDATAVGLARPVPLVVDTSRAGRSWLLRSSGRHLALTLDSLRRLREVPGVRSVRLRVTLPPPVQQQRMRMVAQ
ncbi:MAG: DNA polymerase III subunit alpha [Candidatus Krumholzibacteriia bacterium]